jgi:hypothetical protein
MHYPGLVVSRLAVPLIVALAGCTAVIEDPSAPGGGPETPAAVQHPPPAGLRTLTPSQYQASVRDVIGADVPVRAVGQWSSAIAAARGGLAPTTVTDYEAVAYEVARWVFEDEARRASVVGCTPTGGAADACAHEFLSRIGRRAFRRALTDEEIARWTGVASSVGAALGDPSLGLEHALAGVLQSPHFLYRAELGSGVAIAPGVRAYSDHEMATRLSYMDWNTTPDDALLDAADRGELATLEGLAEHVERMIADERARVGLRQLFGDLLHASGLAGLEKDTAQFPQWTPELAAAMQEQLVRTAEAAVFGGDYRNLFTSRTVYLDDRLAALYGMPAAYGPELVPVTLAGDDPRGGLLTLPGVLAQHAYPGKTSPALRGLFVRKVLLCQEIPPPPPDVDTTLPAPAPGELVTTRALVARHQSDPTCASCHSRMDPIGLALEHFDAIGGWRETQSGLEIDPSGTLDGIAFDDARGLGEALAQHADVGPCFLANLYAFAAGRTISWRERRELDDVASELATGGFDVREAFRAVATSEVFRVTAAEATP